MRKSGLPPVVDENTKILILGTLPSDTSLATGQYYANSRNLFWKLVGEALSQSFEGLSYEAKVELLKVNRIGLWDAYHSCVRPGSMDKDITDTELNDFTLLKEVAPELRLVCFNGKDAAAPEESLIHLGYQTRLLLSSSPAYCRDNDGRRICWKAAIRDYFGAEQEFH
jgi:TDG/mug DNA glycosylase family protein